MTPVNITPADAKKLVDAGALLVDIREPDEHAREHIPGAKLIPLSRISSGLPHTGEAKTVIFHCRSGGRTQAAVDHLRPVDADEVYILDGGMMAWKAAGFATVIDRKKPIEIMRQVQIAAGSLVLLGALLGWLVHPGFYALSGFVGAGLTFAGVTGFCGMARLLALMPWNRPANETPPASPLKA
ncbi:MAG: rhodanese family protein [Rhodobiaceae bacterium]|nr:rhodanese family protein [Rhodobiaceae bacterium]MCC0013383.1 DUF2892 domain-containing protein [Rhodobiaceae bacterium]MCC0018985.1 DUF2892 domain-containing protein [Rhodobiaceae bacterium]MCC0061503.1 DUF2892 domain-containing protein [Rhodobiaceae bacterium]